MMIPSAHGANAARGAQTARQRSPASTHGDRHARRRSGMGRRFLARAAVPAFAAVVGAVVLIGWRTRGDGSLTAESGVGYALGVCGGTMMVLMLSYSARKRLRWMRRWGRIKVWFQAHMLLGVLGPVAILFHANFGLGSTNSNVALFSMLLVMASGIVGRFLYTRVTHELYGQRATLRELREQLKISRDRLRDSFPLDTRTSSLLTALETTAQAPAGGWGTRIVWLAILPRRARRMRAFLLHDLTLQNHDPLTQGAVLQAASEQIDTYVAAVLNEAQFTFYERLFSLWHALHMPLFILLMAAGIVHVIAVHMY